MTLVLVLLVNDVIGFVLCMCAWAHMIIVFIVQRFSLNRAWLSSLHTDQGQWESAAFSWAAAVGQAHKQAQYFPQMWLRGCQGISFNGGIWPACRLVAWPYLYTYGRLPSFKVAHLSSETDMLNVYLLSRNSQMCTIVLCVQCMKSVLLGPKNRSTTHFLLRLLKNR